LHCPVQLSCPRTWCTEIHPHTALSCSISVTFPPCSASSCSSKRVLCPALPCPRRCPALPCPALPFPALLCFALYLGRLFHSHARSLLCLNGPPWPSLTLPCAGPGLAWPFYGPAMALLWPC
jgi:hypothetical protein